MSFPWKCTTVMLLVKETCPQRSASRQRRSHLVRKRRMPPEIAAAPSIGRRPQEHERGSLQHCSWAARSNEVARTSGGANRQVLLASNREIASGTHRLRSTGATPHEPAQENAPGGDSTSFLMAIQGKLFPQAGVLGIIPHLRFHRGGGGS